MDRLKLNLIMDCCDHIITFANNIEAKNYFNAALFESSAESLAGQIEIFDRHISKELIGMMRNLTPQDYDNYIGAMIESGV